MGLLRKVVTVAAALVALIICLIICCFGAIVTRVTRYYALTKELWHPRRLFSKAGGELKAGDVILTVGLAHNFTNSVLTQCLYSHGAVVVEGRNGELFLSEATITEPFTGDPTHPYHASQLEHGSNLFPLAARLACYNGKITVMRLNRPLSAAAKKSAWAEARRFYPYTSFLELGAGIAGARPAASRHCFQHVAAILDAAGLRPPDGDASFLGMSFLGVANEIVALPGRLMEGGYVYEPPYEMVMDVT